MAYIVSGNFRGVGFRGDIEGQCRPKRSILLSKDDQLFKNVMKILGVVIGLVFGLPLVYLWVPGLVTSLLMLGGIVGFFWLVVKFVAAAKNGVTTDSNTHHHHCREMFNDMSASIRYGGPGYISESNSWCSDDD